MITRFDIEQATIALTKEGLEQDERDVVVEKVLDEATNDPNGVITREAFSQVISRAPDFLRYEPLCCEPYSMKSAHQFKCRSV